VAAREPGSRSSIRLLHVLVVEALVRHADQQHVAVVKLVDGGEQLFTDDLLYYPSVFSSAGCSAPQCGQRRSGSRT
jgi:hypothetical protein